MAKKSNIRSIRISDQMAELIDQQVGSNFTEKWENLVTRCVWELPRKKEELQQLERKLSRKWEQYKDLIDEYNKLNTTIQEISDQVNALGITLSRETKKWDEA